MSFAALKMKESKDGQGCVKLVKLVISPKLTHFMNTISTKTVPDCSDDVSPSALGAAGSLRRLLGLPRRRLHLRLVLACHRLTSKGGQQV